MKFKLLLSLIAFSLSTIAYSQKQPPSNKDSTLILQLENDWAHALVQRDNKVFSKLLAEDFFYTENEKMYTRKEVLESAMSVSDTVLNAHNEDMKVHLFGNNAIVTGWLYVSGKNADGNFKRQYRFTDVWVNNKGTWQLQAAQDYLLP